MINAEFTEVKTVLKFHKQIVQQQEAAHGEHYCAMHKAIKRFWAEGKCKKYMELGTHQDTMRLFDQVDEQLHTTLTEWGDVNGFRVVDRGEASVGYTVIMRD